jgi:hypothetical protein
LQSNPLSLSWCYCQAKFQPSLQRKISATAQAEERFLGRNHKAFMVKLKLFYVDLVLKDKY